VTAAYSVNDYIVQVIAGLGSGAILFLVASGLTLIFGALGVVNFAHGSLCALGAYVAFEVQSAIGNGNFTFWLALLVAGVVVSAVGGLMEVACFRPIYGRPLLTQLLVSFSLVLIFSGLIRFVWGVQGESTSSPPFLSGGVHLVGRQVPTYELFLIACAVVVAGLLGWVLQKTTAGRMIRAAVSDAELLALSGVNVRWLFTIVFVAGSFLAGLAGGLLTLQGGIGPEIAVDTIILAFVVVVLGGLGSITGTFIASLVVGVAEALGTLWLPEASLAIAFGVLVFVLAVRPQGLLGAKPT
jgi:branched-subunit amino acid ABC-type transport system permease component